MNNINIREKFTKRSRHIRMCIAHALCKLMTEKPFEKITITELVHRANVSRMTFYKYYWDKQEVLCDYLYEIVNEYVIEITNNSELTLCDAKKRMIHFFSFFQKYSAFFLIIIQLNMHAIIFNTMNSYIEQYVSQNSNDAKFSKFELYFYGGALCNTYLKWIESGMKESPEEIAAILTKKVKEER